MNPKLAIRQKEEWIDIYRRANIELIAKLGERGDKHFRGEIMSLLSDEESPRTSTSRNPIAKTKGTSEQHSEADATHMFDG